MTCGVYKIINIVNGKVYIGSSVDLNKRKKEHFSNLRRNAHHSVRLQRAFNKYGEENFLFEIVEECEKDILLEVEQKWMDENNSYKNGYNCRPNASNLIGRKHTLEERKKISESNKGKKRSKEFCEKARLSKIGKYGNKSNSFGHVVSEETKKILSEKNRGTNSPRAKLNEDLVKDIRKKYDPGIYTQEMLSEEYNVSRSNIRSILEYNSWKHI